MVVVETVCDFSLALSYVGGPNMWVSETDHSDCICCHDMREIVNSIYFLFPEERPYGQASFLLAQSSNSVVWFSFLQITAQRWRNTESHASWQDDTVLCIKNEQWVLYVLEPYISQQSVCICYIRVIIHLFYEEVEQVDPSKGFLFHQLNPLQTWWVNRGDVRRFFSWLWDWVQYSRVQLNNRTCFTQ